MATYYARAVTGNWSANTSWDSTSSGGAGPAGPPIAGDTAIFDAGSTGTITITAAAACAVLDMSNHGGTLAFGIYTLTVSGNVTFGGTITVSSGGGITISGTSTITSNGITFPGKIIFSGSVTYTLNGNLSSAGMITMTHFTPTFSGAYNITCDTLTIAVTPCTLTLVSGQTLTVQSGMVISAAGFGSCTIKSATASEATNLVYNGAASDCKVGGVTFTDVAYSGGTVTNLDNWYGRTLTRTTGIYNVTSASIPAVTDVKSGVEYGGVDDASANKLTGTYSAGGGGRPEIRGNNL